MSPDDPRHGTNAGYIQHCLQAVPSCPPCRAAHSAYKRAARKRRALQQVDRFHTDATGTRRRIQSLIRMGWRYRDMDLWLSNEGATTHNLNRSDTRVVHVDTAKRVIEMYDALAMRTGPSVRNRKLAEKWGWPGPLAWDDDTIDNPAARPIGIGTDRPRAKTDVDQAVVLRKMLGDETRDIRLTKAERAEVCRRLRNDGWSDARIEEHTGLKVDRYLPKQSEAVAA